MFINNFLERILNASPLKFNINSQHLFLLFFLTLIILIPKFMIKIIESLKTNSKSKILYYRILIIVFIVILFFMLKFAIHNSNPNYFEPIIKWFNLKY